MRNKKVFLVSISTAIIFLLGIAIAEEHKVGNEVDDIYLNLNGTTSIIFEISKDTFGVADLTYSGIDHNPVSIKKGVKKITLEQTQDKWSNMKVEYKLIVPDGKNIHVDAGLLNMGGELAARELDVKGGLLSINMKILVDGKTTIKAGTGNLNINFEKCGELSMSGGNLNGIITVPNDTKVLPGIKSWQPLKIHRIAR